MKNALLLFLSLCTINLAAQNSKRVSSKLDAVTVFEQGASFSRLANVDLKPGIQTLVFYGLPINLEPSSIQIGSSEEIEIISIGVGNTPFDLREKPAAYAKVEAELAQIKTDKELLSAEMEALTLEAEFLSKNTQLGGNNGFSLAELQQISAFARDQKRKNEISMQQVRNKLQELNSRQNELQNELTNLKQPLSMASGEVIIKLKSPRSQNNKFSIRYSTQSNVSWYSAYNLYFKALDQNLKLVHKAKIYQGTGEDWDNVKLTLVTGNPSENINMPRLYPRYINKVFRRADSPGYTEMEVREIKSVASQAAGVSRDASNRANYTTLSSTNQVNRMEFEAQERYSLKHRATEAIVVRELQIKAQYEYQSTPSLEPAAFLMAKWEDWEQHQLLKGEISIYNQGLFVGRVYSDFSASSDSLFTSLGKDPQIQIKRERLFNKESSSFLGANRILEYEFKITVSNRKQGPVSIRVFDQVPISQHEDITIKSELPDGAKWNSKTGTVTWSLDIESKSEEILSFSYEIRHPKDMEINW
jgi:uncharacterized protein (TIGR02231 family)